MRTLYIIFLIFSKNKNDKEIYYKMINYKKKKGCVEAIVNKEKAKMFDAKKGNCYQNNCKEYQGEKFIPFVGNIKGYNC